ncbi:hypothetical protein [Candidatus Rhabdochlamydia sp. T3358]|uniref:hypothetical protein n=1 Tax=Candidatus Rhabdochlamydia sp. T3358 TaxID=2099795 RepID=UPI0010B02B2B|nr:hypothetical protein [Candidatus Rhabdochlamydia sp. T3358]VHN99578.1 hypothetical protein RHT_00058 [Candidatus Rhabdochlamydia sp. T3358]
MITITPIIKDQSDTKRFPETIPGAFCNKNYKFIRVAVDSISRLCLALFYQIISYCYKVVGSSTARYYESLANYQNRKVKNFFYLSKDWKRNPRFFFEFLT